MTVATGDLLAHALGDDGVLERSDRLGLGFDTVAGLEEFGRLTEDTDAARRPGRDHLTGLRGRDCGDVFDQFSDVENELLRVRGLPRLAVDPERDVNGVGMGSIAGHERRTHGRECVVTLARKH